MNNTYIVATVKDWNIANFHEFTKNAPGQWILVTNKHQLTLDFLKQKKPKYVFFPHWNWIVPKDILNEFECVCFHMTDVPYGRGGSPLQNLITRGHKETKLTALRMEDTLDTGPVYLKVDLELSGSAQVIFERASKHVFELMNEIINKQPSPVKQVGKVVEFQRRKPEQSEINSDMGIEGVYDHIRMLDAITYPKAFVNIGGLRIEFENASLIDEEVVATVKISKE